MREEATMCQEQHDHQLPCLQCQPQSYIRMVQNLIENCLVFNMGRDECVKALEKNADIDPIVTLTVWKELLKENKSFFEGYFSASSTCTTSTESSSSTEDSE